MLSPIQYAIRSALTPVFAAFALAFVPGSGLAQGSGVVEGFVYDSTTSGPLSSADVVLWDTSFQARTGPDGSFRFEGVPAGEYSVVFFHSKLSTLGVSSGRASTTVDPGEIATVDLAVPSMVTIVRNACFIETDEGTFVYGTVTDAESGLGMPRTTVNVRWTPSGETLPNMETVETNGEGWFFKCGLPAGANVSSWAEFLNLSSPVQQFGLTDDGTRVDLRLGSYRPARMSGTVSDRGTDLAMFGVAVRLVGTNHYTVTNREGGFNFEDVAPGEYVIEFTHLGYENRMDTVQVLNGVGMNVQAQLATEPIELDPIVVTVESERVTAAAAMGGQMFDNATIQPHVRRSGNIADLLRHNRVNGLRIRREEGNFCVEFESGQVRIMKRDCESVLIFVDNARVQPEAFFELPPESIDHFVVFRPVDAGTLFGAGGAHGAIMFVTKDGRRRR